MQKQIKIAFCCQKLFWPFTVWINCSSDLRIFENSRPLASNFKRFSRSLEQFWYQNANSNFLLRRVIWQFLLVMRTKSKYLLKLNHLITAWPHNGHLLFYLFHALALLIYYVLCRSTSIWCNFLKQSTWERDEFFFVLQVTKKGCTSLFKRLLKL